MSHSLSDLPSQEADVAHAEIASATCEAVGSAQTSSKSVSLPYQTSHQVELLHLQAEIEALLHQVRSLKYQHHVVSEETNQPIALSRELSALALR